ncbi:hypothetical protein [Kribbella antiqua]|uniref:hypothetical protein n=1 Tax=Kribbella antiqua TaxID=2512217 RepID=UPI00104D0EC0|nr:hypothetical protein [Kribbella antiqua]
MDEQRGRGARSRVEFVDRQKGFAARVEADEAATKKAAEDALVKGASVDTALLAGILDDGRPPAGSPPQQAGSVDGAKERVGGATTGRGTARTVAR